MSDKLKKLNLTAMTKGGKLAFVEIDTIGTMLEDEWSITAPVSSDWEDLVPLRSGSNNIWCFNGAVDLFVSDGWCTDDPAKRIYKKLRAVRD